MLVGFTIAPGGYFQAQARSVGIINPRWIGTDRLRLQEDNFLIDIALQAPELGTVEVERMLRAAMTLRNMIPEGSC